MAYSVIIALLVLAQSTVQSQDTTITPNKLDVTKAVEIAYNQNPRIKKLQYKIKAQQKQQALSIGLQDPQISYMREGIDQGMFSEQRWQVSQQLEFPLTSIYRYKSAKAQTGKLELRLQSLKLQVKADVKKAYTKLAYAIENSRLAQERIDLFEDLRNAAQMRSDLGESSEIDAMQADLQYREAQNNMQKATNRYMSARYNLFQTIGLEPQEQDYSINFPDTLQYVDITINQEDVLQKLRDHPQLTQYDKEKRSAAFHKKVAKSNYLPDISASYYRQDYGNGFDFSGFEVGLSIPLWFGASQSKRVQKTQAQYQTVQWKYEDNWIMLKKQAEQTWHGYQTSRDRVMRYQETIQTKSSRLVSMTQKGYRLGELDLLKLLEAQRTYLRTQQSYYKTLRDYYLRLIELERYLQGDIIFN